MEIVKLIICENGKEKYSLYFRKSDIFDIRQFCEDNNIYHFIICEGEERIPCCLSERIGYIGATTDYSVEFYRTNINNITQDEVYSFWLHSSNPLDYEIFCNDNNFYKFQIRFRGKRSPFYYFKPTDGEISLSDIKRGKEKLEKKKVIIEKRIEREMGKSLRKLFKTFN